jgi:hypothetical protein
MKLMNRGDDLDPVVGRGARAVRSRFVVDGRFVGEVLGSLIRGLRHE